MKLASHCLHDCNGKETDHLNSINSTNYNILLTLTLTLVWMLHSIHVIKPPCNFDLHVCAKLCAKLCLKVLINRLCPQDSWEIVEGLRGGFSSVLEPQKQEGYMLKRRKWPMKGWHKV